MPRKKRSLALDRTSSLNKYFLCDKCDVKFQNKNKLLRHDCLAAIKKITCKWCNVKLQSKACLANHARLVHGDMCYSKLSGVRAREAPRCSVCSKMFAEPFQLRYHIRRQHFNLRATPNIWLQKKINQANKMTSLHLMVWFEKVLNSNCVVEMRRVGPACLVLRPAPGAEPEPPPEPGQEDDLSLLYPTGRRYEPVPCKICGKEYGKRDMNKHMEEVHTNAWRHECTKCNAKFKRLYIFLKHTCEPKRRNGIRHKRGTQIKISKCESLAKK